MSPPNHQTIRLSKGRHRGPDHGACVMELASMLAGEAFSDHPRCASPVIASFLRTYNDLIDDERRQTLYRYAALVVGTRGRDDVEDARGEMCAAWIREVVGEGRRSRRRRWRLARAARGAERLAGEHAARECGRIASIVVQQDGDVGHARVLAFLDHLIAMPASHVRTSARVATSEGLPRSSIAASM